MTSCLTKTQKLNHCHAVSNTMIAFVVLVLKKQSLQLKIKTELHLTNIEFQVYSETEKICFNW